MIQPNDWAVGKSLASFTLTFALIETLIERGVLENKDRSVIFARALADVAITRDVTEAAKAFAVAMLGAAPPSGGALQH